MISGKSIFKITVVILCMSISLSACTLFSSRNAEDVNKEEGKTYRLYVCYENGDVDETILPVLGKSATDDEYEFIVGPRVTDTITIKDEEGDFASSSESNGYITLTKDTPIYTDSGDIVIYTDVESLSEWASDRLDELMSDAEISQENYCDFVENTSGAYPTDSDFRYNISVDGADMHHVVTYLSTTVIFLHFRSERTPEYLDYYRYTFPSYNDSEAIVYEGDDYTIYLYSMDSAVYISGDTFIFVSSLYEDEQVEVCSLLGFPSCRELSTYIRLVGD